MPINPWTIWAGIVVVLAFAWGLLGMLWEASKGIRWRLYARRYWRSHCRGNCQHCASRRTAQRNA